MVCSTPQKGILWLPPSARTRALRAVQATSPKATARTSCCAWLEGSRQNYRAELGRGHAGQTKKRTRSWPAARFSPSRETRSVQCCPRIGHWRSEDPMSTTEERRADGIQRVPVEALVEVCGVGAKQTPFEAESADVSGRGIRLRTAYLPEEGAPVVCRFENAGREVIAEGVVAWCQKETRGGEFGVRFTALDAQSAETLRELCGIADDGSVAPPPVEPGDRDVGQKVALGAKVKLHIEGLG